MSKEQGYCHLSQIPLRAEPKSASEMVTQMLYGEGYDVLKQEGDWYYVKMHYDGYEGWLSSSSIHFDALEESRSVQSALTNSALVDGDRVLLSMGSELGHAEEAQRHYVADLAKAFLGSPYLWGGRHFSGIDCSGFVQVVYKVLGVALPRDASQQQKVGKALRFEDLSEGDLVFFEKNARVMHVGIVLRGGRVIHSHGKVRIDVLDAKGIYNEDKEKYTHEYHSAKRIS